MMDYKSIEIDIGVNLKSDLDSNIKEKAQYGWKYIGSIENKPMDTLILVFEREH